MAKTKQKKIIFTVLMSALLVIFVYLAWPASSGVRQATTTGENSPTGTTEHGFDKSQLPLDEASSIWVVVNKGNKLPSSYRPADLTVPAVALGKSSALEEMHLRSEAAKYLRSMFSHAKQDAVNLILLSGFRSHALQEAVYGNYASAFGVSQADTFSARAGHSEHQTGLAADIGAQNRRCELDICFKDTAEGRWLAANAHRFGYIIRYQENTQKITGYQFEPWHLRYVGVDLANQIYVSKLTMEEFFGLKTYSTYPAMPYEIKNI